MMRQALFSAVLAAVTLSTASTYAANTIDPLPAILDFSNPILLSDFPDTDKKTPTVLTFYYDNDGGYARCGNEDDGYTAGVAVTFAAQSSWAHWIGENFPSFYKEFDADKPGTTYALGLNVGLDFFTPVDISDPNPIPNDRPYAGWLYGGVYFQRARVHSQTLATQEHIEIDFGMVGPASQAKCLQTWIHKMLGDPKPMGWANQVNDEFGFNAIYERKYRFTVLSGEQIGWPKEFEVQLLPQAGFTLGTIDRFFDITGTVRAGWDMPDDFGAPRIHNVASATGSLKHSNFGIYGFFRVYGKLVEHNTTLQGNNFRDYPLGVTPHPAVGEITPGIAIQLFKNIEFTYSLTFRSKEFEGQAGADSFGSYTLSFFTEF